MEIKVDNDSVEVLVQKHIRLAVAEALQGKTDYLVERLVDEALRKPAQDRYGGQRSDRKTVIEVATDAMIREAAQEAAAEWLAEQKPKIKQLIARKLGSKTKGLIASIADQMVARFDSGFDVSVWIKGDS